MSGAATWLCSQSVVLFDIVSQSGSSLLAYGFSYLDELLSPQLRTQFSMAFKLHIEHLYWCGITESMSIIS